MAKDSVDKAVKGKAKLGCPTTYTEEIGARICDAIATHDIGMDKLAVKYDWFPHKQVIFQWMRQNSSLYDQYLEARRLQSHLLADKSLDMADNVPVYTDMYGNERIDAGMLGREKFRFECAKWHASKLAPKVFGDRLKDDEQDKDAAIHEDVIERKRLLDEQNKKEF